MALQLEIILSYLGKIMFMSQIFPATDSGTHPWNTFTQLPNIYLPPYE